MADPVEGRAAGPVEGRADDPVADPVAGSAVGRPVVCAVLGMARVAASGAVACERIGA